MVSYHVGSCTVIWDMQTVVSCEDTSDVSTFIYCKLAFEKFEDIWWAEGAARAPCLSIITRANFSYTT